MRYCCMFEIMTIHMHKLVKISGIVNRQPWNRLNSYAAHSVVWARRKQNGVQIMSWHYSVYPGTLGKTTHTRTWHPGGLCDFKGHGRQSRVIKATRYDWLLATTNVDWARTLQDFRLTDSFSESVRRLLSWSVQQHTNVLASLRPAYISRLTPKCRMICRLTPKSCVQSANVR